MLLNLIFAFLSATPCNAGVDRALTADNRFVRLTSLYTPDPEFPESDYTGGDVKRLHNRVDIIGEYDTMEPIEVGGYCAPACILNCNLHMSFHWCSHTSTAIALQFSGLAYTYNTKRVTVKAGETIKIVIVLGGRWQIRFSRLLPD